MDQETQLKIVKDYIIEGRIRKFSEIFRYLKSTYLQELTGMNYYKLLRYKKSVRKILVEDIYTIAHALKVPPRSISNLIHNDMETKKK